jgi:hypothetical protein
MDLALSSERGYALLERIGFTCKYIKLTVLSQVPSSVQNLALAARALRGDTAYYRHPAAGIEYELTTGRKSLIRKKEYNRTCF